MVRGYITHTGNVSSHLLILMLEVNVGIVSVLTLAGDVYVLGATYSANLAYTPASVSCSAA